MSDETTADDDYPVCADCGADLNQMGRCERGCTDAHLERIESGRLRHLDARPNTEACGKPYPACCGCAALNSSDCPRTLTHLDARPDHVRRAEAEVWRENEAHERARI